MNRKLISIMLAVFLVSGLAIGGVSAWLNDSTGPVTNTFTVGDINIKLTESTGDSYTITPGTAIGKDPKVTVNANSEACWLFIRVEEKNWPALYEVQNGTTTTTLKLRYEVDQGTDISPEWIPFTPPENQQVAGEKWYYRKVDATTVDVSFDILKNNQVICSDQLTKTELQTIKANPPQLIFTAHAIQQDNLDTELEAWTNLKNSL